MIFECSWVWINFLIVVDQYKCLLPIARNTLCIAYLMADPKSRFLHRKFPICYPRQYE